MNGVFVGNRERKGDVDIDAYVYSLRELRFGIPSREICHCLFHCSQNEPIHHSFVCTPSTAAQQPLSHPPSLSAFSPS